MKTTAVMTSTTGLRTDVDPVRTTAAPNAVSLTECLNVDVDSTGRVVSLKGPRLLRGGNWSSLWNYPSYGGLIGVEDDALSIVSYDGQTVTRLRNVTPNLTMRYADASDGEKVVVFYSNGEQGGKIIDGLSYPFAESNYVGPSTDRQFQKPFEDATGLVIHQGRLLLSKRNAVYYSEPFAYETFSYSDSFLLFSSDVTCLGSMNGNTLFVGTGDAGWLVNGTIGVDASLVKVFNCPCVQGVPLHNESNTSLSVGGNVLQDCIFVMTTDGVFLVSGDGVALNMTEKAITKEALYGVVSGCSVHARDRYKYLFSWGD